jgi:hypothetical protein
MLLYVQKQDVKLEDSLIGAGGLRRVYKVVTGCVALELIIFLLGKALVVGNG